MHRSLFIMTYSEEAEQYERGISVCSASREIANCDLKANIPSSGGRRAKWPLPTGQTM